MGKSKNSIMVFFRRLLLLIFVTALGVIGYSYYERQREVEALRQIVSRLTAEERVAEVWVKEYVKDDRGKPIKITIKILEKRDNGNPLNPIYCTFSLSDIIHFEALVIRLNDEIVMNGKGKSIYLFRRAFALDDSGNTYEKCDINRPMEVPEGYKIENTSGEISVIERKYWRKFWEYALDNKKRDAAGVKNAQIEAPATRFVPNTIYRIILEHDGGLRIEATPIPDILKGERVE